MKRLRARVLAELEHMACLCGLIGYCVACDSYGWSWPHRNHGCWRYSRTPAARRWRAHWHHHTNPEENQP